MGAGVDSAVSAGEVPGERSDILFSFTDWGVFWSFKSNFELNKGGILADFGLNSFGAFWEFENGNDFRILW